MDTTAWDTFMTLGQQAYDTGDMGQAVEAFGAAAERATEPGEELRLAASLNNLAAVFRRVGDPRAVDLQEHSLALLRQRYGDDHPELVIGLGNLAEHYLHLGRLTDAEAALLRAAEMARKGRDPQLLRQTLERLGSYHLERQRIPDGTLVYEEIRDSLQGDNSEDLARVCHMLANLYDAQGRSDDAEAARQRSVDVLGELWGKESAQLGEVLMNMAESLAANGQMSDAARYAGRARALLPAAANHEVVYLREAGLLEQSETVARASLESVALRGTARARMQNELGLSLFLQGRFANAASAFESSLALWAEEPEAPPAARASARYNLASAWLGLFEWQKALEELETARALASEHLGRQHPLLERILISTVEACTRLGDSAGAERARARLEEMSSRAAP